MISRLTDWTKDNLIEYQMKLLASTFMYSNVHVVVMMNANFIIILPFMFILMINFYLRSRHFKISHYAHTVKDFKISFH